MGGILGMRIFGMRVAEMRMLRWMCGHTRNIRNDDVHDKVGMAFLVNKMREARLR